jgi:hypothetical protein
MRVLTVLAMIALSVFAVVRGWGITEFAQTQAISNRSNIDDLRDWIRIPGIMSAALQSSLARTPRVSDVEGARDRARKLTALLSVRPLSSEEWLSLAEMRVITGQPENDVRAALLMSSLSGPNEEYVMWQRGLFGLFIWQSLSPDARRRIIRDLAVALHELPLGVREIGVAKNLLSAKPDEARSEISRLLKAEGVTKADFDRVGL